jgi:hypothetical protein
MNSDFKELLQTFNEENVSYLVVGGYAVIHYSQPRYTKDLDVWVEPTAENAKRVARAFLKFGLPMEGVTVEDFASEKFQFFIGVSPCAFDFLTSISGLIFTEAWPNRITDDSEGFPIWYLGKKDLITAKQSAGRPQDLADLDELRRTDSP